MIPILFPPDTTKFNTNGLGRLADAESCEVTEERNGAYELEMVYPITGLHFKEIRHSNIIYAVPADGKRAQPFRIYSISKPISGKVTVNAEHISYQASHIPVAPFTASSAADVFSKMKESAAESCPFTFWTDIATSAQFKCETPTSMRSLFGGSEGSILDVYGGEWEFDGYDIRLYNARGRDSGVYLRYGKNITDLTQEENIQNTFTGIMPFWKGSDDSGNENMVILKEKVLHSDSAANFPYQRTKVVDFSSQFETTPTEEQLRTAGAAYIRNNNIGVPNVSIKVSFVALWETEEYKDIAPLERVNLCDTVHVEFAALGVSTKAKVIKTVYNVLMDRYKSIELGEASSSFSSQISDMKNIIAEGVDGANRAVKQAKSEMQHAIEEATEMIQGGLGGNVVINTDANGKPIEILIMDTPDKNTAVNVIRINMAGIGFSTNGYNGKYETAWLINGKFNAKYIMTGTLKSIAIEGVSIKGSTITGNNISGGTIKGTTIEGNSIKGGSIDGTSITGTVVTGSTVQSADKGNRVVMDDSSSVKGFKDGTMVNAVNVMNEKGQIIIDSPNGIIIRTPELGLIGKSSKPWETPTYQIAEKGTNGGLVDHTEVTKVEKDYNDTEYGWVPMYGNNRDDRPTADYDDGNYYMNRKPGFVFCTLPVWLKYDYVNYKTLHGIRISGEQGTSPRF